MDFIEDWKATNQQPLIKPKNNMKKTLQAVSIGIAFLIGFMVTYFLSPLMISNAVKQVYTEENSQVLKQAIASSTNQQVADYAYHNPAVFQLIVQMYQKDNQPILPVSTSTK